MAPWIKIRLELYRQLENHVRLLLGREAKDLQQYREQFNREFEKGWRVSSRDQLLSEIAKSDIVLLADFHALQQSQKAQLRILRAAVTAAPAILAVEFIDHENQAWLDRWMEGGISDKEFLQQIDWVKSWGFPWDHYRPLLRFAQKRGIKVYGINRTLGIPSRQNLQVRDDFAGERILEIRKNHPGHRIFVVFGDLHLASAHLPRVLERKKGKREIFRTLTVFQNPEKIYFSLLSKGQEMAVEVVRLSRHQFCILSVPPWVKWQNYLMFLERHLDRELHGETLEYSDHVGRYLRVLAEDFSIQVPVDQVAVYTPDDAHFWSEMENRLGPQVLQSYRSMVQDEKSFFVPEMQAGYLARPSVNHASQLAMAILHSHLSGWKTTPVPNAENFLKMIWLEAVQYFGTKMINPRRKTDTLHDIRAALASRQPKDLGQEALQLALHQKMKEILLLNGQGSKWNSYRARRTTSYREASRLLGGLLGEKLYTGLRKGLLRLDHLLLYFKTPVDGPEFSRFYLELIEVVEGLPEPFLSKLDRI
ncbi:MAG: hypothetical protein C5B49_11875 [Bdellovibrio sp.]|nr:MAG: hypothetical protein C5B49_11875 [Bdellovibrio sp.]